MPERVRVQTVSGREAELIDPALEGDSVLVGTGADGAEIRVSVAELAQLRGRFFSFGQTLLLTVVTGYAVALALAALAMPAT